MYESLIAEARAAMPRYGVYRNWLLRSVRDPRRLFRFARIAQDLWDAYTLLCERGTVVWGAVVQVNPALFTGELTDAPANFVFSTDPYFESTPTHLVKIANRIGGLKGTFPEEPVLANLASIITDESNYLHNWRVPYLAADGHTVTLSSVLLHASWLPNGWLPPLFPVVAAPELTSASMALPIECWPALLRKKPECLRDLPTETKFHTKRVSNEQREEDHRIATEEPHRPRRADQLVAGASSATITITANCADSIRRLVRGGPPNWYIKVGGDAQARSMEIMPGPPPRDYEVVTSQEIKIAIPRKLLAHVRGTVIEYEKTPLGEGFRFIEP